MSRTLRPIFIFALPRSGSTLLQRLLAAHPAVEAVAEPGILLPLLYSESREGVLAEYGHRLAAESIQDFCAVIDGGVDAYRAEIRELAMRLYARATRHSKTRYFVDKTPVYALVASQIIELFPEGRFIFLFRHPLAVAASNNETFAGGRWYVPNQKASLFTGLSRMLEAYRKYDDRSLRLSYEQLVGSPSGVMTSVFDYLDLPWDESVLTRFADVELSGRRGDPVGVKQYKSVSLEPLTKWKQSMGNPLRRAWCRRYLRWIGRERLSTMGYDLDGLLAETRNGHRDLRYLLSDVYRMSRGVLYCGLQGPAIKMGVGRSLKEPWADVHAYS